MDGLLERLIYLHYGLAIILGFIAFKLILHAFHGYDILTAIPEPTIAVSLSVIIGVIVITVILSLRKSKQMEREKVERDSLPQGDAPATSWDDTSSTNNRGPLSDGESSGNAFSPGR